MGAFGDVAHAAHNLVPVHVRHHEVAQHEGRALLPNLLKSLLTVFCHVHPGTEMGQQHSGEFAMIGMVLNDQHGDPFQGHGSGYPE